MMHWQAFPEMARQFIASNSFETLVAGAFGAFFGAWGAQAIITRNQTKLAVITELNSVNAAFTLCVSICNKFMSLKRQHVRPMRDRYAAVCEEYVRFQKAGSPHIGAPTRIFELHADLQTMSPVKVPVEKGNAVKQTGGLGAFLLALCHPGYIVTSEAQRLVTSRR